MLRVTLKHTNCIIFIENYFSALVCTMAAMEGDLVKGGVSPFAKWSQRWYELTPHGILNCFTDATKAISKGIFTLDEHTVVKRWPSIGSHQNCLLLVTGDDELYLSASDAATRDKWFSALLPFAPVNSKEDDSSEIAPFSYSDIPIGSLTDAYRRHMYSEVGIPAEWIKYKNEMGIQMNNPDLQFLDHAWGHIPPYALYKTCERLYCLYSRFGNSTWDVMFVSGPNGLLAFRPLSADTFHPLTA